MRTFIALYGGTFDPVHIGHVGAMRAVLARSGCDRLHVIPAPSPPLRDAPAASPEVRLHMLRLACGDLPRLVLDARELQRSGASYTVDTLEQLRRDMGADVALGWVIGADALGRLPRWRRWQDLLELSHLLVLERPGEALPSAGPVAEALAGRWVQTPQRLREAPAGRAWLVGQPPVDVSASQIRELIASGQSAEHLLPAPVWRYIKSTELYATTGVPPLRGDDAEIE